MASVTIRDVAKQAGVGVGTVSRVLNDNPFVSEATRQKVLLAIEELNYAPSPIARRLSLGKTLTIAVIAPFFTRPSVVERLRGIEYGLAEAGYDLVLHNVESTERRDFYFQSLSRRERVDGLLLISLPPTDADAERFLEAKVPIVLVDAPHPRLHQVVIDDVEGGRKATQHLLELGHRRIAYLSDFLESPFNFVSSRHRFDGYRQALAAAGIAYCPEYLVQGEHGRAQARRMAQELLSLPEPPTAIFAASDTQAFGVLEAARRAGLRVPDDLSVIGYDDIEVAEYLGLTTVSQPLFASGVEGAKLLLEAIDKPISEVNRVLLPTELVVRTTTQGVRP